MSKETLLLMAGEGKEEGKGSWDKGGRTERGEEQTHTSRRYRFKTERMSGAGGQCVPAESAIPVDRNAE